VGYPFTCLECHDELDWDGATFDHLLAGNGFALVGAHVPLPCTDCHLESSNQLIFQPANENDCAACHQADYDGEHIGTGFPSTCLACHNVDTWEDATFADHAQYFPIYSGPHSQGKWGECSKCHTDPNHFMVFTCLDCHEHSKLKMDDKHKEENEYVYDSLQCYSCHPDGKS
jgi:mRNA-degrading endonuclease YafQ of YafQ-DinJ toxin-antitoxin module